MAIFRGTGGQGDSTTDTTVTTVTQKAAEAASSATSAATSATAASNSATSAETSATNAATSETNAANSATASATSATASETAKTAAEAAQTAAETAETNAETAEANAETAQAAAEAAQAAAETAQTNAETAETNAETAETNAETAYANTLAIFGDAQDVQDAVDDAEKLAVNPEDSQYTLSDLVTTGYSALHYAAKAEDSAALAQAGKDDAETASDAATASSTLAATYASNASDSADDAAVSASQALSYKNAAENRYDLFNDRFLGQITGDPDTDNNGDPLITGALYFNTTENEMRVYTGSAWEPVQELSGDQTVNSLTSNNDVVVKGNLEVQGTTITVDSATAQTIDLGDNDRIRLGDSDDLQVYHDGTDSYIANSTGTLKLSGNTDVTGNITVSGTVDGRDIAADGTTLDAVASTYVDVSGDTMTGDLAFGDGVKAKFGISNALQVFHNGNGRINNVTGDIIVTNYVGDADVRILTDDGSGGITEYFKAKGSTGEVILYHYGSEKLKSQSTGIDVTGTVTADGLTVDSSNATLELHDPDVSNPLTISQSDAVGEINLGSAGALKIGASNNNSASDIVFYTKSTKTNRVRVDNIGDISFYSGDGLSQDFYWDASTSRLGLGTTSPSQPLDVSGKINQEVSGTNQAAFRINADLGTNENRFIQIQTPSTDSAADGFTFNTNNGYIFQTDGANNFEIGSLGDISFYNEAGTSKNFYWDASSSRLGLNNTSPSSRLHIDSGTSTELLRIDHEYAGNSPALILNNQSGNLLAGSRISFRTADTEECAIAWAKGSGGASYLAFHANESERMRIDSSGNVGIGTTSPNKNLSVFDNTGDCNISVQTGLSGSGATQILFGDAEANNSGRIYYNNSDDSMRLYTAGSEAARIDSSGNLLVGTTDSTLYNSTSDTGIAQLPLGKIEIARSGGTLLTLNRLSSDGTIQEFRKDGTTVGSIGVNYSDNLFLSGNSNHAGFGFGFNSIYPATETGLGNDDDINLGQTGERFKDLYLSGGVYLGGTGSANLLDDYEEGTWTPVYAPTTGSFTTMTMDVIDATYTKIGDTVRILAYIRTDDVDITGASGNLRISGLPFTAADYSSLSLSYSNSWQTSKYPIGGYTEASTSQIQLTDQPTAAGDIRSVGTDALVIGTTANQNRIMIAGTYRTTA